jgi:gas vesicle protein
MDQTDDPSSSDPHVDHKPSFDALGKIEVPRAIASAFRQLVEETVHRVEPTKSVCGNQNENEGIDEVMSNERHSGIGPLIDISSRVSEELHQIHGVSESATIVGDDETYRDDDTAVATIATVLGRGREYRALQQHQDETYRDETAAVASTTTVLGRGRERRATQHYQDAKSESSNAEEATTGTANEKSNDTDGIATDTMAEKGHKSSDVVEDVRDDRKPAPQTSDTTIVGCDKTHFEDDTITHADATVLGRGRQRVKVLNSGDVNDFSPESRSKGEGEIYSPSAHTVKEVIVDTSLSPGSLNCANPTMDISALDMTLASPSRPVIIKEGEDDTAVESLLVTPVLDRYRLEPDDTSIGVRVVPNERGTRHEFPKVKNQLQKYLVAQTNMHQTGPRPTPKAARSNDVLESASPFVTQRSRTVYRKTPHPKKAGLFHTIDENTSPNLSDRSNPVEQNLAHPDVGTKSSASLRSPFSRVSLPELIHRPYYRKSLPSTSRRLSLSEQIPQFERRHTTTTTISKVQNSMSRTPLTAAWIAKHMPEESSLLDSFDTSRDSFAYDY